MGEAFKWQINSRKKFKHSLVFEIFTSGFLFIVQETIDFCELARAVQLGNWWQNNHQPLFCLNFNPLSLTSIILCTWQSYSSEYWYSIVIVFIINNKDLEAVFFTSSRVSVWVFKGTEHQTKVNKWKSLIVWVVSVHTEHILSLLQH